MTAEFQEFVREHVAKVEPLETRASLAWWKASTTGDPAAYRERVEIQTRIETILSDRESFRFLSGLRGSASLVDPLDRRQLEILFLAHLGRQCSPDLLGEIVSLSSEVESAFATFRAEIDGRRLSQNDVEEILAVSDNLDLRRHAWEATKEVGPIVAERVRGLARLRNRVASELGFGDYYRLSLMLAEQTPEEIESLFDELDSRSLDPYRRAKKSIDEALRERFGADASRLAPWHYHDPFFQDVPEPSALGLDDVFRDKDLPTIARDFFAGVGLPVGTILARSDVHEREGKNQHAFCIDIDRSGDVRVLLNLKSTARRMSTVLHELGHGVYDLGIDPDLPYVVRHPAHTFVTEGVAMLFGRMSHSPSWVERMDLGDGSGSAARRDMMRDLQIKRQLVFARWCQVMVRFERELYANPEGDLDARWWELAEQYQEIPRPQGRNGQDWAAKIHIVSSPVYYHNYALGEMFASQLLDALLTHLGVPDGEEGVFVGEPRVGAFLKERVFSRGASLSWSDLIVAATGQPLSAAPFVRQFG